MKGHTFCKSCIKAASQKKAQCPMCRAQIPSKNFTVNITMDRIIERNFPEKYNAMKKMESLTGKSETGKEEGEGLFECFACF